jgi:DNA-binding transcriptional LysR family regulator
MSDRPALDRSIDVRQLRYFLALAEELNFRRAAERLHITQPPLSRQIAALEAGLGVALFERQAAGTRLTPAGQRARTAFAAALQAFEAALAEVAGATARGTQGLRLGLPWWVDMSACGAFEAALREAEGLGELRLSNATSPELQRLLQRGEIDAALITLPQDLQGLVHWPVARVPHVALLPAASPLARKRALRLRDLEGLTFLRFAKRSHPALWSHFQRQYDAAGFRPARQAEAPGGTATIAQIAAGRGCTLMPAAFARQRHPGVAARRLLDEVCVEVHLVLAEGVDGALASALRRHAPALAPALL